MHLAIAAGHNSDGKYDATGAFLPEARAYCEHHGATFYKLDNREPMTARFARVRAWLRTFGAASVESLAVFSHGWKDGVQIGVRLGSAARFAQELARVCVQSPRIILYCCDTGRDHDDDRQDDMRPGPGGEGGLADRLRNELGRLGVRATIYAHTTAGHTTWNPWVRRFDPGELAGGRWVVEPQSRLWLRWRRALRHTDLRLRFPFMAQQHIERELELVSGAAE